MILRPLRPNDQPLPEKTVNEMVKDEKLNLNETSFLCGRAAQLNHRLGGYQFEHCLRTEICRYQREQEQKRRADRGRRLKDLKPVPGKPETYRFFREN